MPELPEVETIAAQLRAKNIEGRRIVAVEVNWPRTVEPLSVADFSGILIEDSIDRISRYGKWMIFTLGGGPSVMVHLRMSGSFSMEPGPHDRVVISLSGGLQLCFSDPRKFGRWKVVNDPQQALAALGPDALTRAFNLRRFMADLRRRNRMIKPLLLDQGVVAGLGNIYADEALWEAQVHPERRCNTLSDAEIERLFCAIKHVLRVGVKNRGTSLGDGKTNYRDVDGGTGGNRAVVKAYGRNGFPCERCGSLLEKKTVSQRGTHFCPKCQKNSCQQ